MTDRKIRFLNRVFACRFRFAETARYFQSAPDAAEPASSELISLAPEDWEELAREGVEASAYIEYTVLTPYVSDVLLPFDCVVLHAVALRWRGRAYLICAKSGVGKSTQARWLQTLRPGEFGVICGDRPILSFHDNEIMVHPSPWNGKENWHDAEAAPLAGLILLERGKKNRIVSLRPKEAALEMYPHFIQTGRDEKNLCRVAELETRLLSSVPIWRLSTNEVPASTELLLEAVFS